MGDSDERMPADPEDELAGCITVAADLCATVLLNGRGFGRFAMLMDDLAEALCRPRAEVEAAIAWAEALQANGPGPLSLDRRFAR